VLLKQFSLTNITTTTPPADSATEGSIMVDHVY
jgi:hypothetical protein